MEDYHVVEFVQIEGKQIGFIICYFAMTTWGTWCLCTYRNIFQNFKETCLVCAHVCFWYRRSINLKILAIRANIQKLWHATKPKCDSFIITLKKTVLTFCAAQKIQTEGKMKNSCKKIDIGRKELGNSVWFSDCQILFSAKNSRMATVSWVDHLC